MQMQAAAASPLLSLSPSSPSFNSYPSANLAEIAARVVEEFRQESDLDSDMFNWEDSESDLFSREQKGDEKGTFCNNNINNNNNNNNNNNEDREEEDEDEDEFEFAILCRKQDPPISADEIFFNGQIRPIYPFFNRDLFFNDTHQADQNQHTNNNNNSSRSTSSSKTTRLPLGKLMSEEREASVSCSSSEADDLDNLQPGTYCVWTPKASASSVKESPWRSCKKSNSTGTSKRWKFRDLLYRSNSDGKDTFVFLAPTKNNNNKISNDDLESSNNNKDIKAAAAASGKVKVVEEHHITRSRALKEEDKKRSFLPYRQDLMGLFNNVNGLSRNLRPFSN